MSESNEEPKIIVDDDWKAQVEREKEEAQQAEPESSQPEIPPASFEMLITTLSTQAIAAMGFIPDPMTGQANQNMPMARHFVDTLGILEEKTKGNLTEDEQNLITESLHRLRMAFINAPKPTDSEPESPNSSIELP